LYVRLLPLLRRQEALAAYLIGWHQWHRRRPASAPGQTLECTDKTARKSGEAISACYVARMPECPGQI